MSQNSSVFDEILRDEGFRQIGQLDFRLQLSVWWNPAPDKRIEIVLLRLGDIAILRATKGYYLCSISTAGETWTRDINELHTWLETHFPEVRVTFFHARDVPPELAEQEVRNRLAVQSPQNPLPTVEQIAELQRQLHQKQRGFNTANAVQAMISNPSPLLRRHFEAESDAQHGEIEERQHHLSTQQERLTLIHNLQREYQRKGSAASFIFSIHSNLQAAVEPAQFRDPVRAVVKELTDFHRYQVVQKLSGGKLNIQIAEAAEPAVAWAELWFGGALSPTQLHRLGPAFGEIRQILQKSTIVVPDETIGTTENANHSAKHLGARVISSMLQRLDNTETIKRELENAPKPIAPDQMPITLGQRVDEDGKMLGPATFPLSKFVHCYITGASGSGKSFAARALVEEAARYASLNILVLDPRNQSAGLLLPEDRPHILKRYANFQMSPGKTKAFQFDYFAPAMPWSTPLPKDLCQLARGRTIVSFKGADDASRCETAAEILAAAFDAYSNRESEAPRLLIVLEEAQLFTKRMVDAFAKGAAQKVERAIDRCARESRKFGGVLVLVSQGGADYGRELVAIRQQTALKIFMRNTDAALDYAAEILGDGRPLAQLPTGCALLHHADLGTIRIDVRPSYSKIFELSEAETRHLFDGGSASVAVSSDARHLLTLITDRILQSNEPLNMSQVAALAGVTSKRRLLQLIAELEQSGAILTRQVKERGRPRVVELNP